MRTVACTSCHRPIGFLTTPTGKRMPVDPARVTVYPTSDSSIPLSQRRLIIRVDGQAVRGVEGGAPGAGVEGYVPHWATCTHPDQHRERLVTLAESDRLASLTHLNPVLVGQAPARGAENRGALETPAGRRLALWAGIPWTAFLERFDRVNVLKRWPGASTGGGDRFPVAEARREAEGLKIKLQHRVTVLLGGGVAEVLGCGCAPVFRWHLCGALGGLSATIPHPSGLNRAYNDVEAREAAGRVLREARLIADGDPASVYAALGRDYDTQYQRPMDEAENRFVGRRLRAAVESAERVLDLGAGTALALKLLRDDGWRGRYVGLDLAMTPPSLGVPWVRADMALTPFKPATFDAVISVFGGFGYADGPGTLRAAARVLRPGGRLFFMSFGPRYRARESYIINRLRLPVRHRAWTWSALEAEVHHARLTPVRCEGFNWRVDAMADGLPAEAIDAALEREGRLDLPLEDALYLLVTAVKP